MSAYTSTSLYGVPRAKPSAFAAKTPADYPENGLLVSEFDIWQQDYDGATVYIYVAGTTTLQRVYSDIGLTQEISNPQILLSKEDSLGNLYGKFQRSVYTPFAYQLDIDDVEQTGIRRLPIFTLAGQDASSALVTAARGTRERRLQDIVSDFVHALDFGDITTSPETNSLTITNAISEASSRGGGTVILPDGIIVFNTFELPARVEVRGQGDGVTILQSQIADVVINVTGDFAGLSSLKLDGVSLLSGSIGVYGENLQTFRFNDVTVTRFDQNIKWLGGLNHIYRNLYTTNGNHLLRVFGDGAEFNGLDWIGGSANISTESGIELSVIDSPVRHINISEVDIEDNIGEDSGLLVYGARFVTINAFFDNNEINWIIQDNQDLSVTDREVTGITFRGGQVVGGECRFDGLCDSVNLQNVELDTCEFVLNIPTNQIILIDCVEFGTTIDGEGTKLSRFRTADQSFVTGTTTGTAAVVVYKLKLEANEVATITANATGQQVNGAGFAAITAMHSARRAPDTLAYDAQTANFTVGKTVVGASSGASAIICADSDSGTTGTLSLCQISGEFANDELLTEEDGTGSARVNGYATRGTVSLIGSAVSVLSKGSDTGSPPAGYAVGFVALQQEVLITVAGAAANTVLWKIDVKVV